MIWRISLRRAPTRTSSTSRPFVFTRRELRPVLLGEAAQVGHAHARVRLLALALRMSCPGPGVLFVTIGSTFGSKNIGLSRVSNCSTDSLGCVGNAAPAAPDALAAAASACGVSFSTNFRAVRLLYGPVLIQNSLV